MGLRENIKKTMQEAILVQSQALLEKTASWAYRLGYKDAQAGVEADDSRLLLQIKEGAEIGRSGISEGAVTSQVQDNLNARCLTCGHPHNGRSLCPFCGCGVFRPEVKA